MKKLRTPLAKKDIIKLKCGEEVLLSGVLYTARDVAHKKLTSLLKKNKKLPFNIKNSAIYYAGPTPGNKSFAFGSCGPTTSSRMDPFTSSLLKNGLSLMIGKGRRSEEVRKAIKKQKAVYCLAIGGAGAYLAKRIKSSKLIAFKELGPEAIYRIEVKDFPVIVGIDSRGKDIYKKGVKTK